MESGAPRLLAPDYQFLLNGFVDGATLNQASLIAADWGVLPHQVLIATGRLHPDDYYRALAQYCGVPFKPKLGPEDVAPPPRMTPRQSLIHGLLKDRTREKGYVFAPANLRPMVVREILNQLKPHALSLATPQTVRAAICGHFATHLVQDAVEGLAARRPESSACLPGAPWQTFALILGVIAALYSFALAPADTVKVLTLALALLFVPVIALRLVAVVNLMRTSAASGHEAGARVQDRELPVYTILVPLYREAHMLPGLVNSLGRRPSSTSSLFSNPSTPKRSLQRGHFAFPAISRSS